jgi:hypothetical protein
VKKSFFLLQKFTIKVNQRYKLITQKQHYTFTWLLRLPFLFFGSKLQFVSIDFSFIVFVFINTYIIAFDFVATDFITTNFIALNFIAALFKLHIAFYWRLRFNNICVPFTFSIVLWDLIYFTLDQMVFRWKLRLIFCILLFLRHEKRKVLKGKLCNLEH